MNFIDIFDFSKYFKRSGDGQKAKIGHVNAVIEELGYTETIVEISSAQILNMGSNGVELLPAPGENKYYDVQKILLEVSGTLNYTVSSDAYLYTYDNIFSAVYASDILASYQFLENQIVISNMVSSPATVSPDGVPRLSGLATNKPLILEYYSDSGPTNPTVGNGIMRVIVYSKIRTVGA